MCVKSVCLYIIKLVAGSSTLTISVQLAFATDQTRIVASGDAVKATSWKKTNINRLQTITAKIRIFVVLLKHIPQKDDRQHW